MKAVILAAGESSRFRPLSDNRHKALIAALGVPVIQHTIDELREAGVDEVIVVQGPDRHIEEALGGEADTYVVQEQPKGMGDALRQARQHLDGRFLVLTPYRARTSQFFRPMMEKAEEEDSGTVLVSTPTDEPEKYGILEIDDDGYARDLIEKPDPGEAPSDRKVVGMYLLSERFFDYLDSVEEWEYQFEDALSEQMMDEKAPVLMVEEETNSLKYPWDLFRVVEELLGDMEPEVSQEAEIAGSAELKGSVMVKEGVRIHENAVVKGPAYIGENTTIGNNAIVRDHSVIEQGCIIGANAEVTRSVFQPGSSMHSGFVGDSIVGRDASIGAGTVVANRGFKRDGERPEIDVLPLEKEEEVGTGRTRLGAVIGDDVQIGINCSLMPGVQIGSDARIGPGTVVMENVDRGETVYAEQDTRREG